MITEAPGMRGWGPFRQYWWSDQLEREMHWIERGFLVPIPGTRDPAFRSQWCVWNGVSLEVFWLLSLRYKTAPALYSALLLALWRLGLLEPNEATAFSWRRDFRPFPWRGLKRMRRGR